MQLTVRAVKQLNSTRWLLPLAKLHAKERESAVPISFLQIQNSGAASLELISFDYRENMIA